PPPPFFKPQHGIRDFVYGVVGWDLCIRDRCTSHRKRRAPTGAGLVTTLRHNHQKNPGPAQN
ncbi:hypothetical protein ACVGXE_07735, partial [Escherichia coli]